VFRVFIISLQMPATATSARISRKSPGQLAKIPVSGRLSAETNFDRTARQGWQCFDVDFGRACAALRRMKGVRPTRAVLRRAGMEAPFKVFPGK
jgi:hypothetical protein